MLIILDSGQRPPEVTAKTFLGFYLMLFGVNLLKIKLYCVIFVDLILLNIDEFKCKLFNRKLIINTQSYSYHNGF